MFIFLLILVLGISFFIVGIVLFFKNKKFAETAYKTVGTNVDIKSFQKASIDDGRNTTMYAAIIEFKTLNGKLIRFENPSSSNRKPKLGKEVKILYFEDQPEKAKVDSIFQLYILPVIVVLFGIGMILLAIYIPFDEF